jgi:lipopolysaccharide assembly outer membrane protein LptD (OstA)
LRNLIQRRTKENLFTRFLNLDVYSVFVANTDDHWVRWTHRDQPGRDNLTGNVKRVKEETGFRLLGIDATYSPTRNLDIVTDFQYDPAEGRIAFWDIGLRSRMDKWTFYTGCLSRDHDLYDYYWSDTVDDTIIYGGFAHQLCDTMEWSLYARYNIDLADLEEIGGYLQYNLDCIAFRLTTEYMPTYVTEDNYKHDSDVKISLGAWLRAFPMDDEDDWQTWGNFVHMKRLKPVQE